MSSDAERGGRAPDQQVVLEARDVHKSFGGVRALQGMMVEVRRGTITGLIGPNGAGKSTLFDVVSGVALADWGQVLLYGEDVTRLKPHEHARKGMVRTFQISREMARLTVLENLMLAPQSQLGERLPGLFLTPGRVRRQESGIYARARQVLDLATLTPLADEYAENLSGGQKKLLELARALMIDCDLILLDEPGAGVNPSLMRTLVDMVATLNRDHGKTFMVIEHDMDLVAELCDPVVVMSEGRCLVEGRFADVKRDRRVIEAYLGGAA